MQRFWCCIILEIWFAFFLPIGEGHSKMHHFWLRWMTYIAMTPKKKFKFQLQKQNVFYYDHEGVLQKPLRNSFVLAQLPQAEIFDKYSILKIFSEWRLRYFSFLKRVPPLPLLANICLRSSLKSASTSVDQDWNLQHKIRFEYKMPQNTWNSHISVLVEFRSCLSKLGEKRRGREGGEMGKWTRRVTHI